jgi:quercetin dioxygenase-like cupin family protein
MSTHLVNERPAARCRAVDDDWQAALRTGRSHRSQLHGEHLSVGIGVYRQGETVVAPDNGLGEEVATVLEGEFRVDAAGERYELLPGEGIVIPPREPRTWICLSERGVLYRVLTQPGAGPSPIIDMEQAS